MAAIFAARAYGSILDNEAMKEISFGFVYCRYDLEQQRGYA